VCGLIRLDRRRVEVAGGDRDGQIAVTARGDPPAAWGAEGDLSSELDRLQRSRGSRHYVVMSEQMRFQEMFRQTYPAVSRFVFSRGYQSADAEDLIAATYEIAWRRRDQLLDGQDAIPWLLKVVRNLALNAYRKTAREQSLLDRIQHAHGGGVDRGEQTPTGLADWPRVQVALQQLRPIDRELVLLVAWDELTPAQAGRVLGLRPVAARSRLHRARRRLAGLLNTDRSDTRAETPLRLRRTTDDSRT
jgi:RNA polymerase sigma-70 factor (ECF subfamily)